MLRRIIESAAEEHGTSMSESTVLSPSRDPYRFDTPRGHRFGQWLADAYAQVEHSILAERIHLRGLHYLFVGSVVLPDGSPYINTAETWGFLLDQAAPAARWLGYLPWDTIRDARNAAPQVFTPEFIEPFWRLSVGEVELYLPETLTPRAYVHGNLSRQKWRQVVIAEKQGVEDLLLPVCRQCQASLALPAGEVSAQMIFDLMAAGNEDGRPLVIHQLGDCDPAGWQMVVSTARKVQALRDSQFPDMTVHVTAPALTVEQAELWSLPSTPLKDTEKRADRWLAAMGREQTELDAAVARAPLDLRRVTRESLLQYFDPALEARERKVRGQLEMQANERLSAALVDDDLSRMRDAASIQLAEMQSAVDEINDGLRVAPEDIGIDDWDDPEVLVGEAPGPVNEPLYDSEDSWYANTQRMKERKGYGK